MSRVSVLRQPKSWSEQRKASIEKLISFFLRRSRSEQGVKEVTKQQYEMENI